MKLVEVNDVMTEREFASKVISCAVEHGWMVYAVLDARNYAKRTSKGYPDLTMARKGRLIFAELKSQKGKMSDNQFEWRGELLKVQSETMEFPLGGKTTIDDEARPVRYAVWRPSDWDEIEEILRRDAH